MLGNFNITILLGWVHLLNHPTTNTYWLTDWIPPFEQEDEKQQQPQLYQSSPQTTQNSTTIPLLLSHFQFTFSFVPCQPIKCCWFANLTEIAELTLNTPLFTPRKCLLWNCTVFTHGMNRFGLAYHLNPNCTLKSHISPFKTATHSEILQWTPPHQRPANYYYKSQLQNSPRNNRLGIANTTLWWEDFVPGFITQCCTLKLGDANLFSLPRIRAFIDGCASWSPAQSLWTHLISLPILTVPFSCSCTFSRSTLCELEKELLNPEGRNTMLMFSCFIVDREQGQSRESSISIKLTLLS